MMETAATAATIGHGLAQHTMPLNAKWHRIQGISVPRSSHTISVVSGRAYIFGGEITPHQPVDNAMHIVTLPSSTASSDYREIPAKADVSDGEVPQARVGHTAAVIGERIFVYGGHAGDDSQPLEENGRVWVYDTRMDTWSSLDPVGPSPAARSYHTSIAIEKPVPKARKPIHVDMGIEEPKIGTIAEGAREDGDAGMGYGTLFVHAGCSSSGRVNDFWAFDVASRTWKEFPDAPGKPRSGTSLAISKNRIFRFGGFNGESEEGGQIDYLELGLDVFNDKGGNNDEVAVTAKGSWESLIFTEEDMKRPGNRSVTGMHTITSGMGREYLLVFLGERDPSSDGHAGAGKFWSDVWTFQLPPQGMTAASFKDATWQALGRETGEGKWEEVMVSDAEGQEGEDIHALVPGERGWFSSAVMGDVDSGGIILWGGVNEKNERLGDGWVLRVH